MVADTKLNGEPYGVFYWPTAAPTYGANAIQRLAAVYQGNPVDGGQYLLSWKELSWTSSVPATTGLYAYVRSAATTEALATTAWSGPYFNGTVDVTGFTGRWMQISMVMYSEIDPATDTIALPVVSSITVSSYVSTGAQRMFTKNFNLGFTATHVLITYNGTVPAGSLVQFAISGKDSTDTSDYQIITPHTVAALTDMPYLSKGIKVMLMASGSTEVPFVVDEFALALSGEVGSQAVMS